MDQHKGKLPWVPEVFLACGGNFRCWPKANTSSAVGRSREKNLWHGAVLFTVPVDLCAFLSDYIYANQIESLQLWSCGPAREEVSKDPHYPQQNKLEFKIHCFKSNHDWVTLQFSIVDVSRLGSENHYPWEFNILLKTLTSWSQRDKTLPETVTFTDKKKIAYNYSDPEGKIKQPKTLI